MDTTLIHIEVETAHTLTIKYRGPTDRRGSAWVTSWAGWPSEGSRRPVSASHSYTVDRALMARRAAKAFEDWINDPPDRAEVIASGHLPLVFEITRIIVGTMGTDQWHALVNFKHVNPER